MFIKKAFKATIKFTKDTIKATIEFIVQFLRAFINNIFGVLGLMLMTIGAATLLSVIPMEFIALPMWIESTFVIPVLATLVTTAVVTLMSWQIGGKLCLKE